MWAAIATLVLIGLLHNTPAWAEANAECPGDDTTGHHTGHLSIPVTPPVIYLVYGGPAQTYKVSLCKDPKKPVHITVTVSKKNLVVFSPNKFDLNSSAESKLVSVSVDNKHKASDPFEVVLTQSGTSKIRNGITDR